MVDSGGGDSWSGEGLRRALGRDRDVDCMAHTTSLHHPCSSLHHPAAPLPSVQPDAQLTTSSPGLQHSTHLMGGFGIIDGLSENITTQKVEVGGGGAELPSNTLHAPARLPMRL